MFETILAREGVDCLELLLDVEMFKFVLAAFFWIETRNNR